MAIVTGSLGDGDYAVISSSCFHYFLYYPVPFQYADAGRRCACCVKCVLQLELPLPASGIQWGDISTERERIAGFGVNADKVLNGEACSTFRELTLE